MGLKPLYDKGPQWLLWANSRAARVKMTASGVPNFLMYCVIFIVYITQFTSVITNTKCRAAGWRPMPQDILAYVFKVWSSTHLKPIN
jgi:hypothetical protein